MSKDIPATVEPVPSPVYDDYELYEAVSEAISTGPTTNAAIDSDIIATAIGSDIADSVSAIYKNASGESITINLTKDNVYKDRKLCTAGNYKLSEVSPTQYKKYFPKTIDANRDTELAIKLPAELKTKDLVRRAILITLLIVSVIYVILLIADNFKSKE